MPFQRVSGLWTYALPWLRFAQPLVIPLCIMVNAGSIRHLNRKFDGLDQRIIMQEKEIGKQELFISVQKAVILAQEEKIRSLDGRTALTSTDQVNFEFS